jgi:hypothetical protein
MCEALLIVEVEGSDAEIDAQLALIMKLRLSITLLSCAKPRMRMKPGVSG